MSRGSWNFWLTMVLTWTRVSPAKIWPPLELPSACPLEIWKSVWNWGNTIVRLRAEISYQDDVSAVGLMSWQQRHTIHRPISLKKCVFFIYETRMLPYFQVRGGLFVFRWYFLLGNIFICTVLDRFSDQFLILQNRWRLILFQRQALFTSGSR